MTRASSSEKDPGIGAVFRMISNRVRDRVYAGIVEDGYRDLGPAHLAMFRYPGLEGTRPSQLAIELQMSKQALNVLAGHLERRGYIVREPDSSDGRGRVIRLTARGRRLEAAVHERAREAEREIAELLGPRGFSNLQVELRKLFRKMTRLEDEQAGELAPSGPTGSARRRRA